MIPAPTSYERSLHEERKARLARIESLSVDFIRAQREAQEAQQQRLAKELSDLQRAMFSEAWAMIAQAEIDKPKRQAPETVETGAPPLKLNDIMRRVAGYYGVTPLDIVSSRRTVNVVRPRQVFVYLARKLTTRSYPEICRFTGGRDHTTGIHSYQKISALLLTSEMLRSDIEEICKSLGAHHE